MRQLLRKHECPQLVESILFPSAVCIPRLFVGDFWPDQATDKISGTSNYGNKLIKEIKFINPPNYLNFKFKKIIIGNTNNLGNDYISLSKMFFYAREINNEELDKINNI